MKRCILLLSCVVLIIGTNVSADMYLDSNGNVGIGIASPAYKLSVNGTIESKAGGIKFPDGTIQTTAATGDGNGDITSVNAGPGLSGGGTTGDVTLSTDTTYLQRRVSSSCAEGSSIRTIHEDGTVICETDNGSGGITVESDPTVLESVKDGVSWTEVTGRPAGLDDGDDVGITSETDPKIGSNTSNYIPKWNGNSLVSGTIYDNGKIGIGSSNPFAKLELYSPVAITDWWYEDAYMLRLESGSLNNPLNTIQIIKSYGHTESELRFDNGDDILAAIYTKSNDYSLKFLVASPEWYHVTFDTESSGDLGIHLRADTWDAAALVFNTSWDPNATAYASKIYRPSDSNDLVVNFSGIGDVMTFNSSTGNIGIGTTNPQSSLQVAGYVQLALTSGSPPSTDCDEASERGRMIVDSTAELIYICVDTGWTTIKH